MQGETRLVQEVSSVMQKVSSLMQFDEVSVMLAVVLESARLVVTPIIHHKDTRSC